MWITKHTEVYTADMQDVDNFEDPTIDTESEDWNIRQFIREKRGTVEASSMPVKKWQDVPDYAWLTVKDERRDYRTGEMCIESYHLTDHPSNKNPARKKAWKKIVFLCLQRKAI